MCPDRELLSAYFDGEVPSPWRERIEAHLLACPECAEAAKRYESLDRILREDGCPSETVVVDRLRQRLGDRLSGGSPWSAERSSASRLPTWSRSISLPLPLAAAAALAIVFLTGLVAAGLWQPSKQGIQSIAAAEIAAPIAKPASIDELLRFLDSQNAQATLTIRLPSGATFENPGNPVIMRTTGTSGVFAGNGGSP